MYIPNELVNKIIMMSRAIYPYITELKSARITYTDYDCYCVGYPYKPYFGCFEHTFNNTINRKQPSDNIIFFNKIY